MAAADLSHLADDDLLSLIVNGEPEALAVRLRPTHLTCMEVRAHDPAAKPQPPTRAAYETFPELWRRPRPNETRALAFGCSLTGGMIWYSQIPVHGSYVSDLLPGYVMVGVGVGFAFSFVPVSIAALAGVVEREAGPASGLINTSQQIGGAVGVAVASTVFTTHFNSLIADHKAVPVALTGGYAWAFWALAVFAALAFIAALTLIKPAEMAEAPGLV